MVLEGTSVPHGSLLEVQILGLHPRPAESETLGWGDLCFNQPSQWLQCRLEFDNHWSSPVKDSLQDPLISSLLNWNLRRKVWESHLNKGSGWFLSWGKAGHLWAGPGEQWAVTSDTFSEALDWFCSTVQVLATWNCWAWSFLSYFMFLFFSLSLPSYPLSFIPSLLASSPLLFFFLSFLLYFSLQ